MNYLKNLRFLIMLPLIAVLLFACETENDAENEAEEFSVWVDTTMDRLAEGTEEEWNEARTEFDRRSTDLDTRSEEWDEETRRSYEETKARWSESEARAQARWQAEQNNMAMAEPSAEWSQRLLGTADYQSITAANIMDRYRTFMETVRQQNDNWTDMDWEQVQRVYERLDQREEEIDDQLSTSQEAQITAWKAEYRTIQAGEEVKDALSGDDRS